MRHDGPPPKPLCGSLQPCSSVLLPRASPPSKVGSCATARGAASSARETAELDKRPKGGRDGSDFIVAARYSDSDPHSVGAFASLGLVRASESASLTTLRVLQYRPPLTRSQRVPLIAD